MQRLSVFADVSPPNRTVFFVVGRENNLVLQFEKVFLKIPKIRKWRFDSLDYFILKVLRKKKHE